MRLVRFAAEDGPRPGLLQDEGIVDLRRLFPEIPDLGESFFRQGWPEKVAEVEESDRRSPDELLCPLRAASKIICLGKNYLAHAQEGRSDAPEAPLLFCKAPSALSGPFDPILLPRSSGQVDWEVELAVVIGKAGKRISANAALEHIAGYAILNDVSAREAQFSDSQWFRGKSFDSFAPFGPVILTPDEIEDVHDLRLTAHVDGVCMQDGHTRDMIFDIPAIIAYVSEDITLIPGDIISTGTPAGVGIFRDPPVTLKPGNVVECRIEPIGAIVNRCVAP